MSEQPYQQPPVQQAQPADDQPEAVPAGEPVTIQPAEPAAPSVFEPQSGPVEPPAGGPGEQSLAEQQAAGASVTADVPQPAAGPGGSSPYAAPAADYPAEATEGGGPVATQPAGNATSNESPMLPGNLVSGAARAHAALNTAGDVTSDGTMSEGDRISRLREIIDFALTELDRFLPQHVRQPAADEVSREL